MSKQSGFAAAISFFVLLALVFSFPMRTTASPPDHPAFQAPCATSAVTATLNGTSENPPNASPATGSLAMTINAATGVFSGNLIVSGLSAAATASHIHQAPAGVNGPVVLAFIGIPASTSFNFAINAASAPPSIPLAAAILASPSSYYVNVHSVNLPGGEIRGQLSCAPAAVSPTLARPAEVPEADTLILVTSGLGALATWVGWKWHKPKRTRP